MRRYRQPLREDGPEPPEDKDDANQAEAFVLARLLEILGEATGVRARPEDTWAAAASGMGPMPTDPRSWALRLSRVATRLDLHCSLADSRGPRLHGAPLVARLGNHVGSWLVLLGRKGRKHDVLIIYEGRERRMRMSTRALDKLLSSFEVDEGCWLRVEPTLPLESLGKHRLDAKSTTRVPIARLRSYMRIEREDLGVVVTYSVVVGAMTLLTPVAVQALVNTIAFGALLQPLVVLSLLLLVGLTFAGAVRALDAFVVEILQRRFFVRVATDFGRRLPQVSLAQHRQRFMPEMANRFFDIITVQKAGASLLVEGLGLLLQTFLGLILLAFYHPAMLLLDMFIIAWLALVIFGFGRGAVRSALNESSVKYRTAGWLEQVATHPLLFKTPAFEDYASSRTELLCRDYLGARGAHFKRVMRQIIGGVALQVFVSVALLGAGGWLVIQRELTLGQLVAAELVIAALGAGFIKLGKLTEKAYDLLAGVEKIGHVVDIERDQGGSIGVDGRGPAELGVRNLDVGVGAGPTVLRGVNLNVRPGEHVSLVGEAGSGKTTLMQTMAGLVPARAGLVRLDGLDLRSADLRSLRRAVTLVRGCEILQGTVLENLVGPETAPSHRRVREVLRILDLDDAVSALPDGLDTKLLPDGAPLSEAQSTRLVLGRALLARPRLLLIDGTLDSLGLPLDRKARLMQHLTAPDAPWTLIISTRDLTVSSSCGAMYRLENGKLVKEGSDE